ncbi:hypothetical protein R6242_19335 [Iodobacter sp. CM08]|uniref:hypothetical protein n=1 Tax=Iodobacter sp. CM08 TaxID=3085902 RepID=UPI00298118F0|nr:hypothetical protein [Iodobacter sp. CM08]MDW5418725.1 hypothetical protein [Iodobacter sp. CM08]
MSNNLPELVTLAEIKRGIEERVSKQGGQFNPVVIKASSVHYYENSQIQQQVAVAASEAAKLFDSAVNNLRNEPLRAFEHLIDVAKLHDSAEGKLHEEMLGAVLAWSDEFPNEAVALGRAIASHPGISEVAQAKLLNLRVYASDYETMHRLAKNNSLSHENVVSLMGRYSNTDEILTPLVEQVARKSRISYSDECQGHEQGRENEWSLLAKQVYLSRKGEKIGNIALSGVRNQGILDEAALGVASNFDAVFKRDQFRAVASNPATSTNTLTMLKDNVLPILIDSAVLKQMNETITARTADKRSVLRRDFSGVEPAMS